MLRHKCVGAPLWFSTFSTREFSMEAIQVLSCTEPFSESRSSYVSVRGRTHTTLTHQQTKGHMRRKYHIPLNITILYLVYFYNVSRYIPGKVYEDAPTRPAARRPASSSSVQPAEGKGKVTMTPHMQHTWYPGTYRVPTRTRVHKRYRPGTRVPGTGYTCTRVPQPNNSSVDGDCHTKTTKQWRNGDILYCNASHGHKAYPVIRVPPT